MAKKVTPEEVHQKIRESFPDKDGRVKSKYGYIRRGYSFRDRMVPGRDFHYVRWYNNCMAFVFCAIEWIRDTHDVEAIEDSRFLVEWIDEFERNGHMCSPMIMEQAIPYILSYFRQFIVEDTENIQRHINEQVSAHDEYMKELDVRNMRKQRVHDELLKKKFRKK